MYPRLEADVGLSSLKTIFRDLDFWSPVNRCKITNKILEDAWNEPGNSCKWGMYIELGVINAGSLKYDVFPQRNFQEVTYQHSYVPGYSRNLPLSK